MKKIVCITGLCGSGKSTVSDFFVSKGYQYIRFGQIVMDEMKKRKLPLNEKLLVEQYTPGPTPDGKVAVKSTAPKV